jgi:hypothetical protein
MILVSLATKKPHEATLRRYFARARGDVRAADERQAQAA